MQTEIYLIGAVKHSMTGAQTTLDRWCKSFILLCQKVRPGSIISVFIVK